MTELLFTLDFIQLRKMVPTVCSKLSDKEKILVVYLIKMKLNASSWTIMIQANVLIEMVGRRRQLKRLANKCLDGASASQMVS